MIIVNDNLKSKTNFKKNLKCVILIIEVVLWHHGWIDIKIMDQKVEGAPTDNNCRHNMQTGFLYYCDFRAEIRRTPGDILIRNCTFENPDTLFALHFDGKHIWCCNRSLSTITYENCQISGVGLPMQIHGDVNEPLTLTIRNSTIRVREGYENTAVIDATNFKQITLENVSLEGYNEPTAICRTEGIISSTDSTPLTIIHSDEPAQFIRLS